MHLFNYESQQKFQKIKSNDAIWKALLSQSRLLFQFRRDTSLQSRRYRWSQHKTILSVVVVAEEAQNSHKRRVAFHQTGWYQNNSFTKIRTDIVDGSEQRCFSFEDFGTGSQGGMLRVALNTLQNRRLSGHKSKKRNGPWHDKCKPHWGEQCKSYWYHKTQLYRENVSKSEKGASDQLCKEHGAFVEYSIEYRPTSEVSNWFHRDTSNDKPVSTYRYVNTSGIRILANHSKIGNMSQSLFYYVAGQYQNSTLPLPPI